MLKVEFGGPDETTPSEFHPIFPHEFRLSDSDLSRGLLLRLWWSGGGVDCLLLRSAGEGNRIPILAE